MAAGGRQLEPETPGRVSYAIESTADGSLVVSEIIDINAPIDKVWAAYTTSGGYESWAAPHARIDLRPGGQILASYDVEKGFDSENTVSLTIVNFVPERVLTLQADIGKNWPEILRRDAVNLYNVILFEELGEAQTRITSYALGYRDSEELRGMMQFFEEQNRMLYGRLIAYLEAG